MNYIEAILYFYSGTGNSYRVATWMAGAARAAGAVVTVRTIGSGRASEEIGEGHGTLAVLVMPTHGFTAPWPMLRFALLLPRRRVTHAVVVATRAGAKIGSFFTPGFEGTAVFLIALILALKGYSVRGTVAIDMPSNWLTVHPGLSRDTVAGIVSRAKRRVSGFFGTILCGKRRLSGWIALLAGLPVLPISLGYLLVGRLFLSKLFFACDRCTGCGICAEHCPSRAIKMRGSGARSRPYWTFHCQSCMRCMAFCPTQAIEASHLIGVTAYLLASAIPTTVLIVWLTGHIPAVAFLSQVLRQVLESVAVIVVLGLIYPVFHLLLKIECLNQFFTHTTLTHYYRRYREPETTLDELE